MDSTCKSKARWKDVKGRTAPASRFCGSTPLQQLWRGSLPPGGSMPGQEGLQVPHTYFAYWFLTPDFPQISSRTYVMGRKGPWVVRCVHIDTYACPKCLPACEGPDQAGLMEFTWQSGLGPWDGINLDGNWSGRPWVLSQPPVLSFTRIACPEYSWHVSLL